MEFTEKDIDKTNGIPVICPLMTFRKSVRQLLLYLLVFVSGTMGAGNIYLYILPFENIQNDPATEWLRLGFVDMLNKELGDLEKLKLRDQDALETIMDNRSLLLHQPRGSENFLLLGKFNRQLDVLKITLQLVDIATWEEKDIRKVVGNYSEVPTLNTSLLETIRAMLNPYLPKETPSIYPSMDISGSAGPSPKVSVETGRVTRSIDMAIDRLEESMDLTIGARDPYEGDHPFTAGDEWSLDLDSDLPYGDNPENAANTELLIQVLNELIANPYNVRLGKPQFEYREEDNEMTVLLPVTYSLKQAIIKEMLTTLPYSGLKQDGTLSVFYFNKDKFNFPPSLIDKLRFGEYRAVPLIRFFNSQGQPVVVIADTPDIQWHSITSEKVTYIADHAFSPLIDFTVGGWSLQVALETVDISVNYSFTLGMDKMDQLSRVSLKFIPEQDLASVLTTIL